MKQAIKSILAIFMILCMIFTVVGCTEKPTESEQVAAGDDFFTDTKTENPNESQDTTVSNKDTTTSSNQTSGNSSTSSNVTVPEQNTVGGDSWQKVLNSIPKKLKGTTVTVWNWNPAIENTGAPEVLEEFKNQTGIKVDWKTVDYAVYFTKLAATVASKKNIPDVARTRGPHPSNLLSFQPLSAANYDFSDAAWDQSLMKLYTYNGKAYATSLSNTHIGAVDMVFYNKNLISKYEFEDPYTLWKNGKWTYEKFVEMATEFKKLGGGLGITGEENFNGLLAARGFTGAYTYDGSKFVNVVKSNELLTALQSIIDLYVVDGVGSYGRADVFNDGGSLFYLGGSVHLRRKNSYFGGLKETNAIYAVPMPVPAGQTTYYQGTSEAEAYAIVDGATNPEAVPYFLRYYLDGANYELNTYFVNKQNLEVYNWCMSQPNKVYFHGFGAMHDINTGLLSKRSAHLKSYIDENAPVIDNDVKSINATITKLK